MELKQSLDVRILRFATVKVVQAISRHRKRNFDMLIRSQEEPIGTLLAKIFYPSHPISKVTS